MSGISTEMLFQIRQADPDFFEDLLGLRNYMAKCKYCWKLETESKTRA